MRRLTLTFLAVAFVAGCGDPLSDVPRLTDIDIAVREATAQALPSDDEVAREGFFGTSAAQPGESTEQVEIASAPEPRRRGLWRILGRATVDPAPEPASLPEPEPELEPTTETGFAAIVGSEVLELDPELSQVGRLGNQPETEGPLRPDPTPPRRGLLARITGSGGGAGAGSNLPEVDYGSVLPFGVVARNCGARRREIGRKVATSSAQGYRLYDSDPGNPGPRTFYITGFDDGCPRQLTAANVLLGAPSFYEILRYGPAGKHLKTGATDAAYEDVKRRVCGVRRGAPCGAKIRQMERSTFFVNAYPRAKDNTRWSEVLIHDGEVMATAQKGG